MRDHVHKAPRTVTGTHTRVFSVPAPSLFPEPTDEICTTPQNSWLCPSNRFLCPAQHPASWLTTSSSSPLTPRLLQEGFLPLQRYRIRSQHGHRRLLMANPRSSVQSILPSKTTSLELCTRLSWLFCFCDFVPGLLHQPLRQPPRCCWFHSWLSPPPPKISSSPPTPWTMPGMLMTPHSFLTQPLCGSIG